jgi:hypothetical protein
MNKFLLFKTTQLVGFCSKNLGKLVEVLGLAEERSEDVGKRLNKKLGPPTNPKKLILRLLSKNNHAIMNKKNIGGR